LAPLVVLMVLLGLYPRVLLDRVEPSTEAVLDRIEATTTFSVPEPGRATDVFASESGEE
jgi:NADH:ubiquinone oxidoreductase subunit 4 (subunit M)